MKKKLLVLILISACLLSQAQNNFTALSNPTGGSIASFQFEGTKVYALEQLNRHLYVTENNGASWLRAGEGKIINPYAFYIENSTKWYYADYDNFYTSTNSGSTWTRTGGGIRNGRKLFKLPKVGAISDVDVFVLETDCEGIYISSNAGATWKLLTDNIGCVGYNYQVAVDGNGAIYFTDYERGIRRHPVPTDDVWDKTKVTTVYPKESAGLDFALSVGVKQGANKVFIEHSTGAGTILRKTSTSGNSGSYVALGNGSQSLPTNNGGLWSSNPAGVMYLASGGAMYELTNETTPVWTLRTKPNDSRSDYNVKTVDWKSNTEAYAGTDWSGVFRTSDNAASWTVVNGTSTSNGIQSYVGADIEIADNGNIILKDENGTRGVWLSTNQNSFNYVTINPSTFLFGARNQNKLWRISGNTFMIQAGNGTQRSTDGGQNWSQSSANGYSIYLTPTAGEIIGIGNSFARSTNNGTSWTTIPTSGLPPQYDLMYGFKSEGTNNYFVSLVNRANNQTEYWRIDGSGGTWTALKLVTPLSTNAFSCAGFFELNGKIYASDGTRFSYSTNQGVSWTSVQYFHQHMLPIRQGTGGIGLGSAGTLLITQDDGVNWRSFGFPAELPAFTPKDIAFDAGNNAYVTGYGGPVMKFTGNLIVPSNQLPPVVNFNWQNLNGPYTGRMSKIFRNGSGQLYTGTNSALFRFNSGTNRWDRLVINGFLYSFFDWTMDTTGKLYVLSFSTLFVSSDGGTTWTTPNNGFNSPSKIIVAANGNILVGTSNGILLSTNGGSTYSSPGSLNSGSVYAVGISSTGTLYATRFQSANEVLRSTDNGVTWTITGSGQLDLAGNKEVLSISTLASGAVAITTTDNVYLTSNGGTTWTSIKGNLPVNTSFGFSSLYFESFDKNSAKVFQQASGGALYFNNNQALYSSIDNGVTWTLRSNFGFNPNRITDLIWNGSTILTSTAADGVYQSTNNGDSFSKFNANTGLAPDNYHSLVTNNGKIFTTNGGGRFYGASDDLNLSEITTSGIYTDYVTKLSTGSLIAHGSGISVSTDNGTTWTNQNADNGFYFRLSTADNTNYFAARDLNGTVQIVRSTNLKNWTVVNVNGLPPSGTYNLNYLANTPDEKIFVVLFNFSSGKDELYVISFGTAVLVSTLTSPGSVTYANSKIYAYNRFGNIFETTDGLSWVQRSAPPGDNSLKITSNNYFFIDNGTNGTLWLSRDQGNSWQSIPGLGSDPVREVEIDESTGFVYALANNKSVQKSSSIVIPNDNTNPIVDSRIPAQNATSVPTDFVLTLTFNETVKAVSGKQIKLINVATPLNPLQTWSATSVLFGDGNKTISLLPTVSISNLVSYAVIIDAGAFTDIFGNPFAGYPAAGDWTFKTIDNISPVVTFSPTDLQEGVPLTFQTSVTDNESVSPTGTRIWYRKIGTPNAAFTSADFVNNTSGSNLSARSFSISIVPSWYDAMGLEFYIEAEDGTGNKGRSPSDGAFHYSYVKYSTDANSPSRPKIQGLVSGSEASSYKIIAIPFIVTDKKVTTLFNEKGEPNRANWRLLTYNGSSYDNLPDDDDEISRGKGYWFLQKSFSDVFIENASSPTNNRTSPFKLELKTGWNQIGNPYTLPISWETIRASAPANIGVLKKFNNGTYANATTLNAFEGGFVFLTGPARSVDVPITAISGNASRRNEGYESNLADTHWEVSLKIENGDLSNEIGGIGMHEFASDEADGFDDYNPPSILERVELAFATSKATLAKSVLKRNEYGRWNFTAYAEGNESGKLTWNNDLFGDNEYQLWLIEQETQQLIDMREVSSYNLNRNVSTFSLYYGKNLETNVRPEVSVLGNPYPNPASANISIPYTIAETSAQSNFTVAVYDLKGTLVKSIDTNRKSVGFHEEHIHFINPLPPGLYLIKFTEIRAGKSLNNQFKKIVIK